METGVCSNYGHKENLYCKCCIFPSVQLALVFFMLTREKKRKAVVSIQNLRSHILIAKSSNNL